MIPSIRPLIRLLILVTFVGGLTMTTVAEDAIELAQIKKLVSAAQQQGNPARGAVLYSAPTSACLSCHQIGQLGGNVGPDLSQIASQRTPEQIVASILWPKKIVEEKYQAIAVLTVDGQIVRGYKHHETDLELEIRDSATGKVIKIAEDEIESVKSVGTLMPDGLLAPLSERDKADLIAFLSQLGKHDKLSIDAIASLMSHSHSHHPVSFEMTREPLQPELWPSWNAHVNRDRVYDFYGKQARHFREQNPQPALLAEFPGLDGGGYGHWGNQSEPVWADGRWNETDLGSLLSGVFHGEGVQVARGICVHLTEGDNRYSVCFNPDTLQYAKVWKDGFVSFTDVRHGFMHGLRQQGPSLPIIEDGPQPYDPNLPKKYLGFYRHGSQVIFAYRVGDTEYLDTPSIEDGVFRRVVAPRDAHPNRELVMGGPSQWPQELVTRETKGAGKPYAVDKIELPHENPWKALLYCGGHDFLSDGSAIVCTMQGDVWRAFGLTDNDPEVRWRRIASGLHQALGLVVDQDQIFVLGRDQITRLHDLNGDGEMDFYECFSQALETSTGGHDFTCDLWRDAEGRFYTASGKQGVMQIAADGSSARVLATGLRNSDGLGLTPDGLVTIPSSEGDWMPASMIAALRPKGPVLNRLPGQSPDSRSLPFFGRPGNNREQPPEVPMLYLPRGLDNSSGGQIYVDSDRWGPVKGQMIHLSFGAGTSFLVLRDEFDGWIQGAAIPLTGEFASGAHRGKFNPADGQLYVSGMAGWGSYTTDDGCFQRVRYSGNDSAQLPIGFHVHQNGVRIDFSKPLDPVTVGDASKHFAQAWNYRYSSAYGSPEYSTRQLGLRGHDVMEVTSAATIGDGRSVFLEIPDLQPVNQLHLLVQTSGDQEFDLFLTVNHLDEPYLEFDGALAVDKAVLPHPMLGDFYRPLKAVRNPYGRTIAGSRDITIRAAKNLMFDTTEIRAKAGEVIHLVFENPDAVPHNWALLKPGSLEEVGLQANKLIADPEAAARHYIPETNKVIAYTDVVPPQSKFSIYFRAPSEPGTYPYLCTFPGHWMVMNGTMVVE